MIYTLPLFENKSILVITFLLSIIFVLAASYLINKYLSRKFFLFFLIALGFIIRLMWIGKINTQPVSDFIVMYNAAINAINGDFSFGMNEYFGRWVYQLGFTFYQSFILNVFGDQLLILKLFNIFFNIGIGIIIYLITSKMFNEESGRIASFLYIIYLPNVVLGSVLTNQHLSTFLYFLGIYFIVKYCLKDNYSWILIGLLFGLGNIIRPLGSFFLLGLIVYIVVYKMLPIKKKTIIKYASKLVGVIVIYLLVQNIASYALISAGVSEKPLSNQDPYWKFVVGLNHEKNGMWNKIDSEYVQQFEMGEERNRVEIEMIKERISDKTELFSLLNTKFQYFWGGVDTASHWSLVNINKLELKEVVDKYERINYLLLIIFAFISVISLVKRKEIYSPWLLLILLGGYFLIHLIIEIQTRYRYDIMPIFFVLVGYGVFISYQFIARMLKKE